jgi:hypothetical protein
MVFSQILYSATYQLWGANQIARATSTFKDPNIAKYLPYLYDKFVVFQVGKAITISLECKSHYIDCLIKELCIANSPGNPQYTPSTLTSETLENHILYRASLEFQPQMKNGIFLHSPRYLNCTILLTKAFYYEISKLCACILSMTKSALRSYCSSSNSTCGVNQLLILTKCNDLRVHTIKASPCYSINTFDLSTPTQI